MDVSTILLRYVKFSFILGTSWTFVACISQNEPREFLSQSFCCQIGMYGLVRADVAFALSDAGLEADETGFTLQYAGQRARVPLLNAEELHAMSAMRQRSRGGFLVA